MRTILSTLFSFLIFNVFAQTSKVQVENKNIDRVLKELFFNLNIDSCQTTLEKEIATNSKYKFKYNGESDTIRHGDVVFTLKRDLFFSLYKLENDNQSIIPCDSTFIFLQPALVTRNQSHAKNAYQNLSGHRVSILMYFSDSTKAETAYKNLRDSIVKKINKPFESGDFTIDDVVKGNSTIINIDKKQTAVDYERNLEIAIRSYEGFFEVKLDFEKLTLKLEDCH